MEIVIIDLDEQRVEKEEREFVNAYLDSEPSDLPNDFRESFLKTYTRDMHYLQQNY